MPGAAMTVLALLLPALAGAATYVLPGEDDVVGQVQYVRAGKASLAELARRFDVGLSEMKAANPGVDPRLPGTATRIMAPTVHIMPSITREGIVVNLAEQRLYLFTRPAQGPALVSTFPVSVAPACARPAHYKVVKRLRKPSWRRPIPGKKAEDGSPAVDVIPPGPKNPLGEFALELDVPGAYIHGTNKPGSIGAAVKEGCIRLYPEDIETLVRRASLDMAVRVISDSFKLGRRNGVVYLDLRRPPGKEGQPLDVRLLVNRMLQEFPQPLTPAEWSRLRRTAEAGLGVATPVVQVGAVRRGGSGWMVRFGTYRSLEAARRAVSSLEAIDLPAVIGECNGKSTCSVVSGPYTDRAYIDEVLKRAKWVIGMRGKVLPYTPETLVGPIYVADKAS